MTGRGMRRCNARSRTVIYELHVAGFTRHPSSGVAPATRGTYAGLIAKIPYLVDLGVTAVELLPVFQFDAQDAPPGLVNYWGYSPVSFFAPTRGTARARTRWAPWTSSATWSRRSIAPGSRSSWTWSTTTPPRGITRADAVLAGPGQRVYYILEPDRSRYADYTGTGNTLNANHPVVRRLIVDSLRYWVEVMHVDGFRFDLASILSRDEAAGRWRTHPFSGTSKPIRSWPAPN